MTHRGFVVEWTNPETGKVEQIRVLRWEAFVRYQHRALGAFLAVVAMTVVAGYIGWNADANTHRQTVERRLAGCVDRADIRIAVAQGLDELRRVAVQPPAGTKLTDEQRAGLASYIERTQVPINRLLVAAAGSPLLAQVADARPAGAVTDAQVDAIRGAVQVRCRADARDT